jgi:uncharacterized repeat protein (TIGR01451 family)
MLGTMTTKNYFVTGCLTRSEGAIGVKLARRGVRGDRGFRVVRRGAWWLTVAVVVGVLAGAAPAGAAPFAYVTNFGGASVSQYDATFGALAPLSPATIAAGNRPIGVAVSPDAQSVYVTNELDNTVSQYSVGSGGTLSPKTPATVATGSFPGEVAVSPLAGADLSITKSGSPNPVTSGQRLTYTITVSNGGPQNATGVTVSDPLPASTHFNSASSTQGTCTRSTTTTPEPKDGTVTCSLGGLANGATATVTIVVTPTTLGTLTNTASVTGDQADPTPADNSATATTTVLGD